MVLIFLLACGSSQKISTSEQEATLPQNDDEGQSAYQTELKRNWSFGFENYKNRRYQDAPHFFWRVVEMDTAKTFVDVYSFLANTYSELGMPDSAFQVYELGIRTLPDNSNLYRGFADLLASQNRRNEAIANYQKLVETNTAEEDDLRKLGDLLLANADTLRAITILERVQSLAPGDLEIRQRLSMLYPASNHRGADDVLQLQQRQQQNPNDAPTLLALGKMYYHHADFSKCAEVLELYVALMPTDSYAQEFLGGAYFKLKKFGEAIVQFNMIIADNPKHSEALLMLARCHNEINQWDVARRFAHRALAVDDKHGIAYIVLGEIYEKAARDCPATDDFSRKLVFRLAYEQYEKALLDPNSQGEAKRRIKTLEPLLPVAKDYFTNKNQDRPAGECYAWIYK